MYFLFLCVNHSFYSMHKLLQIALDENNKLVSIFQVATGQKCNCTCPECGEKLEAKNKDKFENSVLKHNQKQAHFAHISGKVCQFATESAIHKMAKEILSIHKTIMLPPLYHYNEKVSDEFSLVSDTVMLESRIEVNGIVIVPDAILIKGSRQLLVEFYKTHQVDEDKILKIKKLGLSALEVDLNFVDPIINGKPNYEGLREYIETDASYSEWLFNSEGDRLYKKKSKEGEVKPLYNLDFLKRQEQEFENELNSNYKRKKSNEEKAETRIKVERWKDKAIEQGYELIKIYGLYDQVIYCPKEKRNENKREVHVCRSCEYFLNKYYSFDEKFVICGFKSKIIKTEI